MKREALLLSTGDLGQVAGLTVPTIDEWCRSGVLVPEAGGDGQGRFRKWTVMQAVGLAVANEVRMSERGCAVAYVATVVEAFAKTSEKQLLKQFVGGKTHLAMVHQGRPLLDGANYDWPNVEEVYRRVVEAVEKLSCEPRNAVGRSRGLAASK